MFLCVRDRIWELVHGRAGKIWEFIWGLEIRTCWLSVDLKIVPRRAKGAKDSYLGGLVEPSGGKSFLGGGKSYWGALLWGLENRTWEGQGGWKFVSRGSSRGRAAENGFWGVGNRTGERFLGLENRTSGSVWPGN